MNIPGGQLLPNCSTNAALRREQSQPDFEAGCITEQRMRFLGVADERLDLLTFR